MSPLFYMIAPTFLLAIMESYAIIHYLGITTSQSYLSLFLFAFMKNVTPIV